MSPTEGAAPRYFARLTRVGPWWCVEFRDCPGCLTSGRGRAEALRMAADALATWCASSPPRPLPPASGTRFLAPLAARWIEQSKGWR